jgi:hypothetical protein
MPLATGTQIGFSSGGSMPSKIYPPVLFANIYINNTFYCECENLGGIASRFSFWSIFGFNQIPFKSCGINREINGEFDVLLMTFEKSPIGKYSISGVGNNQ